MDFKNLNSVWKLKRFCITCIELMFLDFCLRDFCFQFEFFFNFDFHMHETHLKRFVFEILFIGVTVLPFISLMAKFEVYNVFSF